MAINCGQCGAYVPPNEKSNAGVLDCPECGYITTANIFPLFVVTGASGSGKTAVIPELRRQLPECLVFDKDILWGYSAESQFTNSWLRVVYEVAQGGRFSILCGTFVPQHFDTATDRSLVDTIYFLNLHCIAEVRRQRLLVRSAWRQSSSEEVIAEHIGFANWLLANAATAFHPAMPTVDTTSAPVPEVARAIGQWVASTLKGELVQKPAPLATSF